MEEPVGCHEIIASQGHHNNVTLTKCARRREGGNGNGRMELKGPQGYSGSRYHGQENAKSISFCRYKAKFIISTDGIQIEWKQCMLVSFETEKPLDIVVSRK